LHAGTTAEGRPEGQFAAIGRLRGEIDARCGYAKVLVETRERIELPSDSHE